MLNVDQLIQLLNSDKIQSKIATGQVYLADPLTPMQIEQVRTHLPAVCFEAVLPLLRTTAGIEILDPDDADRGLPIFGIDPTPKHSTR